MTCWPRLARRACSLAALCAALAFAGEKAQVCANCHGADGNSGNGAVPSIAGQPRLFIENQLILFREGVRSSEQMAPVARELSDREIAALAVHFSRLPAREMETDVPDAKLMERGRERAQALRCGQCHLPDFQGQDQIPRLAGQREEYLESEMRAYRDSKRKGGDTIMAAALYGVSDADIRALAHFLSRSSARSPAR